MSKKAVADAYVNLIPSAEGFQDGIEKAINEGTSKGSKSAIGMLSNLGTGFAMGIGQAAFGAVSELSSKVVEVAQSSINSYKEYEQLIGGTETLFGNAANYVEDYADAAFKSAGLSANEYLNTVNGMAAALNQSTGSEWQSARLANQAVIDMADNANKMGTSMEMNAYNGFSKQNFTMLDNLKLGYGGTKQEMERLLEDAEKLSGVEYNMDSYADIVSAIHVIQQEMGIAGTTQKEATETIEGSLNMVKSAWDNLIAGLGKDDADLGGLIDKLLNSVFGTDSDKGFLDNLLPRIETVVGGVQEFATQLITRLPGIAEEMLPVLSNMLLNMVNNSIEALSNNLDSIIESLQSVFENIITTAISLVTAVIQMLPNILDMALSIIIALANGLVESIPTLIPTIIDVVLTIVDVILDNLPLILNAAVDIILALAEGIIENLPQISLAINKVMYQIIATIVSMLPQIIEIAVKIVFTLIGSMAKAIADFISSDFWNEALNDIIYSFTDIDWAGIGMSCLEGMAEGFDKGMTKLAESAIKIVDNVKGLFTSGFDIHSPSKLFENYGEMIDEGLAIGMNSGKSVRATQRLSDDVVDNFNPSVAAAGAGGGNITIPVYIGNELIQTIVVDALNMANYRSGGR